MNPWVYTFKVGARLSIQTNFVVLCKKRKFASWKCRLTEDWNCSKNVNCYKKGSLFSFLSFIGETKYYFFIIRTSITFIRRRFLHATQYKISWKKAIGVQRVITTGNKLAEEKRRFYVYCLLNLDHTVMDKTWYFVAIFLLNC